MTKTVSSKIDLIVWVGPILPIKSGLTHTKLVRWFLDICIKDMVLSESMVVLLMLGQGRFTMLSCAKGILAALQ